MPSHSASATGGQHLGDQQLRALPKVSLHEHLDGCLRPATLIELSTALGAPLPSHDPDDLRAHLVRRSHSGSLMTYLRSFALTSAVMQSAANLARIAREYVEDLVADGVVHGEVRWAPEKSTQGGLTLDQAVDAVRRGLAEGVEEARGRGHRIQVHQIITAMRDGGRALEVAELALRHHGDGVVGFDLAGPEVDHPTSLYRDAVELVARRYLPTTIHAGEADGLRSIESALLDGRALRLGHGVRIAEDIDGQGRIGALGRWVRDRSIVLETSPTSNLHTGVFAAWGQDMRSHPFDLLYRAGFCVTVNTDNRLMSDTTLTDELQRLHLAFGYTLDDLERFQLTAARGAFADVAERESLVRVLSAGFDQARSRPAATGHL
ncbi:adenosine deaminase 1 [Streptomyces sulfonofaciens]|uniref:adenosine deaminase n=1 Tax=Streptomyces sulfonofaciens TaxID=68272 RepID=A0A919GLT6_9ACTN|nr:adenosine deaminase [Streptomyces sulfonofaciens]GHH86040.1 adenosine deaminase 1 [Streptomyces sulfonofaciens]